MISCVAVHAHAEKIILRQLNAHALKISCVTVHAHAQNIILRQLHAHALMILCATVHAHAQMNTRLTVLVLWYRFTSAYSCQYEMASQALNREVGIACLPSAVFPLLPLSFSHELAVKICCLICI